MGHTNPVHCTGLAVQCLPLKQYNAPTYIPCPYLTKRWHLNIIFKTIRTDTGARWYWKTTSQNIETQYNEYNLQPYISPRSSFLGFISWFWNELAIFVLLNKPEKAESNVKIFFCTDKNYKLYCSSSNSVGIWSFCRVEVSKYTGKCVSMESIGVHFISSLWVCWLNSDQIRKKYILLLHCHNPIQSRVPCGPCNRASEIEEKTVKLPKCE